MNISFYLAHPAQYHLFKHVISRLELEHKVLVLYNDKDVLDSLIKSNKFKNVKKIKTTGNTGSFYSLIRQFIQKNIGAFQELKKFKPHVVIGTPILVSLIGVFLGYKSIIVNEDDFDIVKLTAMFGYPFADEIVCPKVCRTGKFDSKCTKYSGYHELAYLHPDIFKPDIEIAKKYVDIGSSFFLIRFAQLTAHHDVNIRGIRIDVAKTLIKKLFKYGNVYISSERILEAELEKYRISINPVDIHHVMAYTSLYIGDSQTMAAESGVLGVPFIRYNDFVGRISYLDEMENYYKLGYGIKPDFPEELLSKVDEVLKTENYKLIFFKRRQEMLKDKINVADFITNLIKDYNVKH